MALDRPITDMRMRTFAQRIMVLEQMVRNRFSFGGPLTAQEIVDGVRLSHDEFLELARIAMPELNRMLRDM